MSFSKVSSQSMSLQSGLLDLASSSSPSFPSFPSFPPGPPGPPGPPEPGLVPSDPGPPVATPNWAKTGGSGELGCSGNGSVMHGDTHFLLNYYTYIINILYIYYIYIPVIFGHF
jgi:hypothetical protein